MNSLAKQISALPTSSGVYFFKDQRGRLLYIGKAINLRDRVKSYLAADLKRGPVIAELQQRAFRVDFQTTDSELEAIILEANLIRKLKPKYNSQGKDDKTANFIKIDWSQPYPRLHLVRGKELDDKELDDQDLQSSSEHGHQVKSRLKDKYFGPYVALGLRSTLGTIRKIWPYRDCSASKFQRFRKLGHGCLYWQIGLCSAPCTQAITKREYRQTIKQIDDFLSGHKERVIQKLQAQMTAKAAAEQFEQAAVLRNRLTALQNLRQFANRGILRGFEQQREQFKAGLSVEAFDVSNIQGEYAVGALVRAQIPQQATSRRQPAYDVSKLQFLPERYRKFKIKSVHQSNDVAMLAEVMSRRLRRAQRDTQGWSLPDLLLVDGGQGQLSQVRQVAKGYGVVVPVIAVAKGKSRRRVDLYYRRQDQLKIKLSESQLKVVALKMREEAHRFAISYYRQLHRRQLISI